jgi:hypothetical protein
VIAADTSTWIAFLQGDGGEDAVLLDKALEERQVLMVPVVLTEILSDPELSLEVSASLSDVHRSNRRLLGSGRRLARQGFGETQQGPFGRFADRPVLH